MCAKPIPISDTEPSIHIRPLIKDDIKVLRKWWQPEHAWHRLDAPYYPIGTMIDVERKIQHIQREMSKPSSDYLNTFWAISDQQTNQMIGQVVGYWISRETLWMAVGIALFDPSHWSKGIGFIALREWCTHLFRQNPQFARLDLRTWSGNIGMMRLAEKLGFKQEACFRDARIVDGQHYDGLGYGILRHEFEKKHGIALSKPHPILPKRIFEK